MQRSHKFLTLKKKYGRYNMIMTQHIFSQRGTKRYGGINWVILLDSEHVVLNTSIEKNSNKISEAFLDMHWNIFLSQYNANIDVWSMTDDGDNHTLAEFNDYNKKVDHTPVTDNNDLIDELNNKASLYANLVRKVKKLNETLKNASKEIDEI